MSLVKVRFAHTLRSSAILLALLIASLWGACAVASADPVAQWSLTSEETCSQAVAADSSGNVWALCNDHVEKLNSKGEYQMQFGEEVHFGPGGSKVPHFFYPEGISTDPDGNVWVANTGYGNLLRFNADGEFLDWFGNLEHVDAGHGDGEFDLPSDVAVDSAGEIWAVDRDGNRVQRFHFDGEKYEYVDKIGDPQGKWGQHGDGDGEFWGPYAVEIDSAGNIWVADTYNNRVQKFDSEGNYLDQFGGKGPGYYGAGSENGQFNFPASIAIDSADNVWVPDFHNHRVQKFDSEGNYLGQFGKQGEGDGEFKYGAFDIAVDSADNLWVTVGWDELQKWTILGRPTVTSEAATEIGPGSATLNATIDPEGSETEYHFEYDTTPYKEAEGPHGTSVPLPGESIGSGTSAIEVEEAVEGLQAGETYHYRIVASNENGTSYGEDEPFTTEDPGAALSLSFGSYGTGNGQFSHPTGIATDPEGDIWVVDSSNRRIQQFDPQGKYISQFGTAGSGNGQLNQPQGIAVDSTGNIWVADTLNNRIQKFDSEGKYLTQFGSEGSEDGEFLVPNNVATDSEGNVWVADTENNRIQKFNSEGEYISQFGSYGTGNGEFYEPYDLEVDSEGNVWVADGRNNRIQKFNSEGEYISQFGSYGTGNGKLHEPYGLAIDPEGNVWVADTFNHRVQKFDSEGNYLGRFGSKGSGAGNFQFPSGIAIDPSGDLWVTDGGRVQKWVLL